MLLNFLNPGIQPLLADRGKTIQGQRHLSQLRGNPPDDFENRGMLSIEICPVDDSFVMEDTVAQIANAFPAGVEFSHITLRAGSVCECLAREGVAKPGASVGFIEESGPKTELEFGHHSSRRDRLATGLEFLPGLGQLFLLPRGQRGDAIIPVCRAKPGGETCVEGIAQSDFGELEGRI